jgi:hypothetical protein
MKANRTSRTVKVCRQLSAIANEERERGRRERERERERERKARMG